MTGNGNDDRPPRRPKMYAAIEHLDLAHDHMVKAMDVLASVTLDWQKAANFIQTYRNSLIETVEAAGGDVAQSIEHQIREFIPPNYRPQQPAEGEH